MEKSRLQDDLPLLVDSAAEEDSKKILAEQPSFFDSTSKREGAATDAYPRLDTDNDDDDDDASMEEPTEMLPSMIAEGASGDTENESPRRSNRKRTSTVIHVKGGHTVKKENNYVLKGGSYVYGVVDAEQIAPKSAANKKPRAEKTAKAADPSTTTKRQSPQEIRRLQCKRDIEHAIETKKPLRDAFLKDHLHAIAPFIEDKVKAKILNAPLSRSSITKELQVSMQPDAIQAELRDYQLEGLQFMARMHARNMGMVLGDEMGLGKTLQTISLVCYLKEQYGTKGPCLIICPMSVLYSWCDEIKKWAPTLKYLRFHCSATDDVSIHEEDLTQYDLIVTTYEMAKSPNLLRIWQRQAFHLLVLDEGHRIKNAESQTALAVRKIHAENRVILTGTPLANNLTELHSLLTFLAPDVFTTKQPFAEAFDLTLNKVDPVKLDQAHSLLSVFMLRRLKEKVEKLIPSNLETKVVCPLSTMQIWWYKAILLKDISLLVKGGAGKGAQLNNLIMQLRKCCLHPFLFDGAEDITETTTLEKLVGASGKLSVLDKLLCSLYRKKHRVCLFSQFTQVLDILEDYCTLRGWKFVRFDGSTARAKRNFVVNSFNAPGSDKFLFLMSTRAGGMGLNLQSADTCVIFDTDYNPSVDKQAMARVCRIGQTKKVHTYRLVTEGTVEERMIERAEKKLYLDRMVTRDGSGHASSGLEEDRDSKDVGALMATLKFGCGAVFGQGGVKNALPSDEDIEIITDRSRTDDFSHGKLKGGTLAAADAYDACKSFTSTSNFAGIDFAAIRNQYMKQQRPNSISDISVVWAKKREAKKRIQMVDAKGSGYGSSVVPVLKSNDYDLASGERSIFQQELRGRHCEKQKKQKIVFQHQDFCQVCNDGGELILCPRCPCCVHLECSGLSSSKHFLCCSHHRCAVCGKASSAVGGFLFPCSACPNAYCEDHLPREAKFLEPCERMEDLDYVISLGVYVHCSDQCEELAIAELGFKPRGTQSSDPCPPDLDLLSHFGAEVDDSLEAPENLVLNHKRQRKQLLPTAFHGAAETANRANIIESPDRNDDKDGDFVVQEESPALVKRYRQTSKWQDAVGPSKSVQVLLDGVPHPVPTFEKPTVNPRNCLSTLLFGEYDVTVHAFDQKIGIRIAQQGVYSVFIAYRKLIDGRPNHAERSKLVRNVGDIIVQVGGVSTEGKSLDGVKRMIKNAATESMVALRFFDITALRHGARPFLGAVKGQVNALQAPPHTSQTSRLL